LTDAAPGDALSLLEIRDSYADEYHALTEDEKAEVVAAHEKHKLSKTTGIRVSTKSKIQDAHSTCLALEKMVSVPSIPLY
jgi:hypothetical protein